MREYTFRTWQKNFRTEWGILMKDSGGTDDCIDCGPTDPVTGRNTGGNGPCRQLTIDENNASIRAARQQLTRDASDQEQRNAILKGTFLEEPPASPPRPAARVISIISRQEMPLPSGN